MRKVVILMSITIKGLNSSNYNFGSFSSIRKQAQAIQDRLDAESAARKEEQERTGLIRNPSTGEMVELIRSGSVGSSGSRPIPSAQKKR